MARYFIMLIPNFLIQAQHETIPIVIFYIVISLVIDLEASGTLLGVK
jgi:hypothetical protein